MKSLELDILTYLIGNLFFPPFLFSFINFESMIIHLQETWKIKNKVAYIFSLSFNIKLPKTDIMNRKGEGHSRTENQYEPIQNLQMKIKPLHVLPEH